MGNAWESAKGLAEKHASSGGVFVRLATSGDKVTGVFCGEPYAREVIWTGERYEPYDANNPAHQAEAKRPSLRVALNFYVIAEGVMKIIEGGTQWFKDVLKVRDKYGLDKWSFEIERHGDAGDPKTKYTILPEEKVDAGLRDRISAARLHDLAAVLNGSGEAGASEREAEDGPIDAALAADLIGRMKALPRSDVEELLRELGVQRVRDLKISDIGRTRALLARYEQGGGDVHTGDIDPFA
jgi:hypothetical protein